MNRRLSALLFALIFISSPCAAEDIRDTDSPYGVLEFISWSSDWNANHYRDPKRVAAAFELMKNAGVGMVRFDFSWTDVEPAPNQFYFVKYDRILRQIPSNGPKVLGILGYNNLRAHGDWNSAPDPELFARYVKKTVQHFKGKVKYWEIWNEPNHEMFWVPQDGMVAYTEVLKKSYLAAKEADPSCVVVLGGLAYPFDVSLRQIYEQGGGKYFDVVNFHPFVDPLKPRAALRLDAFCRRVFWVMKKFKDSDKPVWITEVGCPGMKDIWKRPAWWAGKNPTEKEQAAWVHEVYQTLLSHPQIKKVFWAFFRDAPDHFMSGVDYFGLVREDFSKKPSYDAYKEMTSAKS